MTLRWPARYYWQSDDTHHNFNSSWFYGDQHDITDKVTPQTDCCRPVHDLSMKIEVLNETVRKGKFDLITNWCTSILLSLCCRGRDRMVSLFWFTSICVITVYQYFKFVCSLCPLGSLFDTTVHTKVHSWLFVFIWNSGKI